MAVKDEVKRPYQPQPLNLKPNPVSPPQTAPSSGVESSGRVPLVNNRKGSLWLPSTSSSLLRLSLSGSRVVGHHALGGTVGGVGGMGTGTGTGMGMDDPRLQRARSLPVKYRYHPSHGSTSVLDRRESKRSILLSTLLSTNQRGGRIKPNARGVMWPSNEITNITD